MLLGLDCDNCCLIRCTVYFCKLLPLGPFRIDYFTCKMEKIFSSIFGSFLFFLKSRMLGLDCNRRRKLFVMNVA